MPSFVTQDLPALRSSRDYADRGDQAPLAGPARRAGMVFNRTVFPLRWGLRFVDWVLDRPGRALVAVGLWIVLARVDAVRTAVGAAAAAVDRATYYTGLQWLLGLA